MKNKEENKYFLLLYYILALIVILAIMITLNTANITANRSYDIQINASNNVLNAMEVLKEKEKEVSIHYDYGDFYENYNDKLYYDSSNLSTGMIGAEYTAITTTIGNIDSKKTALDPNFAAVYIKMFQEASLKKGDEIVINMSGSFPMLDISCLCAAEAYGLKPFIMVSIGASSFGATNPAFTIFDMLNYLNQVGIVSNKIDIVSLGGSNDTGDNFAEFNDYKDKELIVERIKESSSIFLYEKDFKTNIKKRLDYIFDKLHNVKLFVNIGGNSVGLGINKSAYYKANGLIYASKYKTNINPSDDIGLIEKFLSLDINVIQMLNLKSITAKYGVEYGFSKIPEIGSGKAYYETSYNLIYAIIAILSVVCLLVLYKKRMLSKEK